MSQCNDVMIYLLSIQFRVSSIFCNYFEDEDNFFSSPELKAEVTFLKFVYFPLHSCFNHFTTSSPQNNWLNFNQTW